MTTIIKARQIFLADPGATLAAGADIAADLRGRVLHLSGELGAGKTTLVRGLLRALGHQGSAKSPSYALVEPYTLSRLHLYHFDFYRFNDPREWEASGFAEYFRPDSICVIEWPERLGAWLPATDLSLRLEHARNGRTLAISA